MSLTMEEIIDLGSQIRERLDMHLDTILIRLNTNNQLVDLLQLLEMTDLLENTGEKFGNKYGKILVIGASNVQDKELLAIGKKFGLDKSRFELCTDYEDPVTYPFEKIRWSTSYAAIIVGCMPHSGRFKGNHGSIISALQNEEGFPPICLGGVEDLKLSKSSFRQTLNFLFEEGLVSVA